MDSKKVSGGADGETESDYSMDLNQPERAELLRNRVMRYRRILRIFWWVPALTVSAGLVFQAWQALTKPVTYQSTARIIVSGQVALPDGAIYKEESMNFFGTQVELMLSPEVNRRATARVRSLRPDLTPVPVNISVQQLPLTSIFVLNAMGSQPDYLKAFLNAVIEEYIAVRRQMFAEKSQTTQTAIADELLRVESDLRRYEDKLFDWKRQNNLVFLREEGVSAGGYLTTLNHNLALLESEYNLISLLSEEQNLARAAERLTSPSGQSKQKADGAANEKGEEFIISGNYGPAESYMNVKRANYLLEAQRLQLLEGRQADHPKVKAIEQQIKQNKKLLEVYRAQAIEQFSSKRQSLEAQISNTKEQVSKWEKKSLELSARMGEFERLQNAVERQKNLYDRLLASVQSVGVNSNIQQDILSVMEYASVPNVRINPLGSDLLKGALLGALAGGGILFLIGLFDDRIVAISELQAILAEDVVGIIPLVPEGQEHLHLTEDDNISLAEAFRKLRAWLCYTHWENGPPKLVLITSGVPDEGKSTIASNLAISLASMGSKTLLVDADFCRGAMHRLFEVEQEPGLGNVLSGEVLIEKAIVTTNVENLWIVPRGYFGSRGSEVFLSKILDRFINDVRARFDIVIIDSSPVLAVDETSVLAGKVDAVLLAVRSGVTGMRLAKKTLAVLKSRGAFVEGVIYNGVDAASHDYPYYNYYYSMQSKWPKGKG